MALRKYQEAGLAPSFEFKKPKQMKEGGEVERYHRIELVVEGVPLGYAELHYMSKPIPSFLVNYVFVKKNVRGFGFGGAVMEKINDYIISRGKMGMLCNAIDPKSKVRGIYEAHGWHESSQFSDWMTINEPKNVKPEAVEKAIAYAMLWLEKIEERVDKKEDLKAA
ncbi:MAG: hypothetical protein AAB579_00115 [Patescibacteria group bacterium]|mgnify:CR=1 FL=1